MKKFQVTVVKIAIYEVEVDEKIWNAEELLIIIVKLKK